MEDFHEIQLGDHAIESDHDAILLIPYFQYIIDI
jgi:hypothetical protein